MAPASESLKIGSVVINCKDFDRTVAFWKEALHLVPRDPAEREFTVLRDPGGAGPNVSVQDRRAEVWQESHAPGPLRH